MTTYPDGSLVVFSDLRDTVQGDAVVLSGTSGTTLASLSTLPYSALGDRVSTGRFAVTVEKNDGTAQKTDIIGVNLYDSTLTLLASVRSITAPTGRWSPLSPVTASDRFYIAARPVTGSENAVIYVIDASGTVSGTTYTLSSPAASTSLVCMAVSPDNTILYWGAALGIANLGVIHRWDLVNNTALSDLVSMGSSVAFCHQMFVMSEGDVVVIVTPDGTNYEVRRYTAGGTLVRTINVGAAGAYDTPELFRDIDPSLAWVRLFTDPTDVHSTFSLLDLNTGAAQRTFTVNDMDGGGTVPTTCPVIALGADVPTITPLDPVLYPIRRLRRSPHLSLEQFRIFYHRFQLDLMPGVGTLTGQGVTPTVMLRWSDDGGYTWSSEIELSAGAQGDYTKRVYALMLGSGRDRVFEVSTSDPVQWTLLAAYIDTTTGTN
jgi:hypothetical protein